LSNINLMQGDCLERMKEIPDGSVDMVLTSPPYNMNLRIRNGKYCSRQIVKELTTKYKSFDDNLPINEYFEFNKKVINECLRVTDLVFYNIQMLTGNKPALFMLMGEFCDKIKELIIWDKVNAQPAIGAGVMNSQYELIIVLQNSNPESRSFKKCNFKRGCLSNLWNIKKGKKYSKDHGAVFPVELAKKIIENFSNGNNTILDPFMGLGTTGVAAKNLNRNFIGIELDAGYFEIAKERIKNA
jgi:site-specific DNA-methyltransferase (adenine-specific)